MKNLYKILSLILLLPLGLSLHAQDKASIREAIESKSFTFLARSASPMRGSQVNLSAGYDIRIKGDTLISVLPYYGRAHTATVNPGGGIRFTSTDFTYKMERDDKGWNIRIRPNDQREVRDLFLHVSPDGFANLQVTQLSRDAITFYGTIEKLKP